MLENVALISDDKKKKKEKQRKEKEKKKKKHVNVLAREKSICRVDIFSSYSLY